MKKMTIYSISENDVPIYVGKTTQRKKYLKEYKNEHS